MSNRDSLGYGELLPQDVVDIFAQEKHSRRGQKKRSHSLGRALGWLKGKKRKDLAAKEKNLGLGPALDLAIVGHRAGLQGGHKGGQRSGRQANTQAVLKRNDDDDQTQAPPLLQENVFIEANRPKYLENLHTEALEGLKMMQQEETNDGVEYRDNESTISNMTVHTDGEGFMTDSTIADTTSVVSVQSSVSTRSSRSGLTRQESTFRPLNSGKPEKSKTRRRHRRTVAGIPQHVQRELGLDRGGWAVTPKLDEEQLYNGDSDHSPTTDGPHQAAELEKGASAASQNMNATKLMNQYRFKQLSATHAGHRDDMALLQTPGSNLSGEQRPRSLAVPWLTTANSLQQEPPSPVMSMSPQAAYMSKIIPNAVLPPSIDVVEINRGRSRNSVRTVSKSSLVLSSPAPSRASSKSSSSRAISSRASTINSRYPPNMSDSSGWSHSESSDTLVSDSSTVSSSSTPKVKRSQNDTSSNEDNFTATSKNTSNGRGMIRGDKAKREGPFAHSLSVRKPKKAPPPPNRSFSLHNKMKRRSRDLVEVTVISGEPSHNSISASGEDNVQKQSESFAMPSRPMDSPGYHADTSSLEDSPGSVSFRAFESQSQVDKAEEKIAKNAPKETKEPVGGNKLGKVFSPSSGYSSQDGKPAQLSKRSSSPRHKKGLLAKLQRFFPGSSSPAASQRSLKQPEAPGSSKLADYLKSNASVDTTNVSPSVRTLIELFNIPPPPKVHAPPPPPPEVWAHNKRTFELLLGPPAPENTNAIIKKNPKDRRQQRKSSASTDSSVTSLVVERKPRNPTEMLESINGSLNALQAKKVQESVILNAEIQKENNDRLSKNVDLRGNGKVTGKDEKVRVRDLLNGMLVKAVEKREERLAAVREEEEEGKKTSTGVTEVDASPGISLKRIPPSPSLRPLHNPPQPHAKQIQEFSSVASGTVVVSPEMSWPPPPPPIGLNGPDDLDLPLPPPPVFSGEDLVLPVQVPTEKSIPSGDSSCSITSVVSCIRLTTEAEPQKLNSSQGIEPQLLNIPPPPPYSAPRPPVNADPPRIKLPEEVSLPPKDVASLPPKEVTPPPQVSPTPQVVSPLPHQEVFLPPTKEVFPSPSKDVSPSPPKEVIPPPPPPKEITPVRPKENSVPLIQKATPPPVEDVSSYTLVTRVSPQLVTDIPPQSSKEASTPPTEVVQPPSSQVAPPVSEFASPQNIPQPLCPQQEIDFPQESVPPKSETTQVLFNSILTPPQSIPTPPQSIPTPPPIELLHQPQELSHKPPSQASIQPALKDSTEKSPECVPAPPENFPKPPPLPVEGLTSSEHPSNLINTENQTPEPTYASVIQEEPPLVVTPSLLQMVKLRSVNSSPEPPKAEEKPKAEVTMRNQEPSNEVPTPSTSSETPQKPIRKSMIMTSPTSKSPPAIVMSEAALPKSQSFVLPPASPTTTVSPTKKSPPAIATTPSMNLQEAIRLRTAARSVGGPAPRVSFPSQTSPTDRHKSSTSMASFVFSKSNKMVVTKSAPEVKTTMQKNLEVTSGAKVAREAESVKKEAKMPPPVAKKPKAKGKEVETSVEPAQTTGQEPVQESIMDAAGKTNGTAAMAEGGLTSST